MTPSSEGVENLWFSDSFDGGVLDSAHWVQRGSISQEDGVLRISRSDSNNAVWTLDRFSGDWLVDLDIRLDQIDWNDNFHGLSVFDSSGFGFSFGFSMYGTLFLSQKTQVGYFSYDYADSNKVGQWRHWRFRKSGRRVDIEIDGRRFPYEGEVGERAQIHFPGPYSDGDGAKGSGTTASSLDSFMIASGTR